MVKEIICKTDGAVNLVDDEDYPILSRFPWYRGGQGGHPMTFIYGKNDTSLTVYMHQIIIGGVVNTDHIDRNKFNMQKDNLRPSNASLNGINTAKRDYRDGRKTSSKHKGVFFDKQVGKFRAVINKDRKRYDLGAYADEHDAGRAYNRKAKELFADFAWLNPMPELNH